MGEVPAAGGVQRPIPAQFLHRSRRGWWREAAVHVVLVVVVVVSVGRGGRRRSLEGKRREVGETAWLNLNVCVAIFLPHMSKSMSVQLMYVILWWRDEEEMR